MNYQPGSSSSRSMILQVLRQSSSLYSLLYHCARVYMVNCSHSFVNDFYDGSGELLPYRHVGNCWLHLDFVIGLAGTGSAEKNTVGRNDFVRERYNRYHQSNLQLYSNGKLCFIRVFHVIGIHLYSLSETAASLYIPILRCNISQDWNGEWRKWKRDCRYNSQALQFGLRYKRRSYCIFANNWSAVAART